MKKIILIFLIVLMIVGGSLSKAWAQEIDNPWFYTGEVIIKDAESKSPNLGSLMTAQVSGIGSILQVSINGKKETIVDKGGSVIGYRYEGGIINSMNGVITTMISNQGVSSKEYIADLGHNLGIVPKQAYAQGTGFAALSPILPLWKTMRDITYLFYVVIFMVVGFMILLRKKIDPRTVITIEAALPKLIITLILITFSYAIMGFILDIANLISTIIGNMFAGKYIATGSVKLQELMNNNIFLLARPITNVGALANQFADLVSTAGSLISGLTWLSVNLIFAFAVMFITFKIFFSLLGPFAGIVLSVIFAPIQLLMMAVPGSETNISSFLRNFISKVAVFPVVWSLLIIAAILGDTQTVQNGQCPGIFGPGTGLPCADWGANPTDFSNLGLHLVPFGGWGPVIGNLLAFGIMFTIPSVAQLVQNTLKVKDQSTDIAGQTIRKGMSKVPFMKSLAE